jgi:hypothetical protein
VNRGVVCGGDCGGGLKLQEDMKAVWGDSVVS